MKNFRRFEGVLARLDEWSDIPCIGSGDRLVMITRAVGEAALKTLPGLPLHLEVARYDVRNLRFCGVITMAAIVEAELRVVGWLSPEAAKYADTTDEDLCLAYSLKQAHVDESFRSFLRPERNLKITKADFCDATIEPKLRAAYKRCTFRVLKVS